MPAVRGINMGIFDPMYQGFLRISLRQKHKHIDPSHGFERDAASLEKDKEKLAKDIEHAMKNMIDDLSSKL